MLKIYEVDEWKASLDPERAVRRQKKWQGSVEPKYVMICRTKDGKPFVGYTAECQENEKLFREIKKWLIEQDIRFHMPYSLQIEFWHLNDALRTKLVWG